MIVNITFNSDQVKQTEALLDFIFFLHGKKKAYSVALVGANNIHEEFTTKIRLAAEVAFFEVDMIHTDAANLFGAAVERMESFKEPWIALDPFCVPLMPRWIEAITDAYDNQPKKILGPYLKESETSDKMWLARNSVYPADAFRLSKPDWMQFSNKTRIIQLGKYTGRADMRDKSKDDPAYLFCGDSTGELIKTLREEIKIKAK